MRDLPIAPRLHVFIKSWSLNDLSSEIAGLIFTKFYVVPSVEVGLSVCSNGHAPLNKMVVMPIWFVETLKSVFFSRIKMALN